MDETITLPKSLIEDLIKHLDNIISILATMEELIDGEGLKRIREGIEDYKCGDYLIAMGIDDLKRILFEE
ncbi:MAG: hypothetical protein NDF51_05500 [archaeon YNP-WB-040]|nr:hypothetical protein [Candidatus Culexarchaeum yellowstonense]